MNLARGAWRKSSRSGTQSQCVEVAAVAGQVAARDSKDPDGGALVVSPREFGAFLRTIRAGAFSR